MHSETHSESYQKLNEFNSQGGRYARKAEQPPAPAYSRMGIPAAAMCSLAWRMEKVP